MGGGGGGGCRHNRNALTDFVLPLSVLASCALTSIATFVHAALGHPA